MPIKKEPGKRPTQSPTPPARNDSPSNLQDRPELPSATAFFEESLNNYRVPTPAPLSKSGLVDEEIPAVVSQDSFSPAELLTRSQAADSGTVIYVHGIANKPVPTVLRCQWDAALFGRSLGERSRMVYWVNRERHGEPTAATCSDPDTSDESSTSMYQSGVEPRTFNQRSSMEVGSRFALDLAREVCPDSDLLAIEQLSTLAEKLLRPETLKAESDGPQAEALPLPRGVRQWLTRQLTWLLLGDVYDYMYDQEFRTRVDQTFRSRIRSGGPFLVIGHSLGSVIAYKNMIELNREGLLDQVPLFLTLGSPLGIQEIQDQLKVLLRVEQLVAPSFIGQWINVFDWRDPVAADKWLSNDFRSNGNNIIDKAVWNMDGPRHPHSATGYLGTQFVREVIQNATPATFGQEIKQFVIANDLSERIEELAAESFFEPKAESGGPVVLPPNHCQEVLIELIDVQSSSASEGEIMTLEQSKDLVLSKLGKLEPNGRDLRPTLLKRYVAVSLTPSQIEQISADLGGKAISRIWKDSQKYALLKTSVNTVHVAPAQRSYQAYGNGITWAVLDTGIRADHPHFHPQDNPTVTAVWDCTKESIPILGHGIDGNGHGTHVAGIIAGGLRNETQEAIELYPSNSPLAKLHSYKVLRDDGGGRDSSIIMALDHISKINEDSQRLVIHGINLSLGGTYNPATYGCGYTPICRELYRLWRQGVVIVVAAGNSGYAVLQSNRGPLQANIDLSIGDPANLEDAIAVGSVHKTNPWTHGISFFSSRGPTSDGRQKPDLVAPGERIASANCRFDLPGNKPYVELSGTSMAAPHVSGIAASFLSCREEFVGRPDILKRILLDNCTSIGRSREHQGAGIPNLVKMLAST